MYTAILLQTQNLLERYLDLANNVTTYQALMLKIIHTHQVAKLCNRLAQLRGFSEEDGSFCQLLGWCHDLGRFPQFLEYQTFDDRLSIDHGRLSAQIVVKEKLHYTLSQHQQKVLLGAVALHNRLELPANLPSHLLEYAQILRDADRLDIYRIFKDYYQQGPTLDSPLELGYPNTGQCSPEVVKAVAKGHSPTYGPNVSVQDMRLIKLSWVYTFSHPGAITLFLESGIINATQSVLPDTPEIQLALEAIHNYCKLI